MLKSRMKSPPSPVTELEDYSGNTTTEVIEMLQVLGVHFFLDNLGPETEEQHLMAMATYNGIPRPNQTLLRNELPEKTEREIRQAVFSTPPNKAPWLDGFQRFIFQLHYNILKEPYLKPYNSCLRLEQFPFSWKIAYVIFIKKLNRENIKLHSSYWEEADTHQPPPSHK